MLGSQKTYRLFCFLLLHDFAILVRRYFIHHLYKMLFCFLVMIFCLFDSNCHISFDMMQMQSMTLVSSTFQIRGHEYFEHLNVCECVCVCVYIYIYIYIYKYIYIYIYLSFHVIIVDDMIWTQKNG